MNMNITRRELIDVIGLVAIMTLAGCVSRHSGQMVLFGPKAENAYPPPVNSDNLLYGNNPVFVTNGAKFSIDIDTINPAWLHQGQSLTNPAKAKALTKRESDHLLGKELWIVTRVDSLDPSSPLELSGKSYFKTSSVKLNGASFRVVPLDVDELRVFVHAADSSFRVRINVYEVDQFEIKRAVALAQRNPGLWGTGKTLLETVAGTAGSVLGDEVVRFLKTSARVQEIQNETILESLLLQAGASLELTGTFHVLRKEGEIENKTHSYLLVDPLKPYLDSSGSFPLGFSDYGSYITAVNSAYSPPPIASTTPFLKFSIVEDVPDVPPRQREGQSPGETPPVPNGGIPPLDNDKTLKNIPVF